MAYSHLQCPYCNEVRHTSRGLYWHLRCDHNFKHWDAYAAVGDSLKECQTLWGADNDFWRNDRDWVKSHANWNKYYSKKDSKFFSRSGR